jgi:hypothetical protein
MDSHKRRTGKRPETETSSQKNVCPYADDTSKVLDDFHKVHLFTKENVDVIKVEIPPISSSAGKALADLLWAKVATVLETSQDDIEVSCIIRKNNSSEDDDASKVCIGFYICDATPGGAGILGKLSVGGSPQAALARIVKSLKSEMRNSTSAQIMALARRSMNRRSDDPVEKDLLSVKDYLDSVFM